MSRRQSRKLERVEPDLLLLDVQMPGQTGFDLLEQIESVPLVIFTTAHDEFAFRAFEVSALDYLLKPIEASRLSRALEKAEGELASAEPADDSQTLGPGHRFFVREGERCWFVPLADVSLFESEGNHTRVVFGDNRPLISRSLAYLEQRLDEKRFFRANRSQIVGLTHVVDVETWVWRSFARAAARRYLCRTVEAVVGALSVREVFDGRCSRNSLKGCLRVRANQRSRCGETRPPNLLPEGQSGRGRPRRRNPG